MSDDALRSVIGLVCGVLFVVAIRLLDDWQDKRDLLKQASALLERKGKVTQ